MLIPVAERSKTWITACCFAGIADSNLAPLMDSCECCVLGGRGLSVELITRLEDSYRVLCVLSVIVKPR